MSREVVPVPLTPARDHSVPSTCKASEKVHHAVATVRRVFSVIGATHTVSKDTGATANQCSQRPHQLIWNGKQLGATYLESAKADVILCWHLLYVRFANKLEEATDLSRPPPERWSITLRHLF